MTTEKSKIKGPNILIEIHKLLVPKPSTPETSKPIPISLKSDEIVVPPSAPPLPTNYLIPKMNIYQIPNINYNKNIQSQNLNLQTQTKELDLSSQCNNSTNSSHANKRKYTLPEILTTKKFSVKDLPIPSQFEYKSSPNSSSCEYSRLTMPVINIFELPQLNPPNPIYENDEKRTNGIRCVCNSENRDKSLVQCSFCHFLCILIV